MAEHLTDEEIRRVYARVSMPAKPDIAFDTRALSQALRTSVRTAQPRRAWWFGVAAAGAGALLLIAHAPLRHSPRPRPGLANRGAIGPRHRYSLQTAIWDMTNSRDGLAWGASNGIYATHDGGAAWQLIGTQPSPHASGLGYWQAFSPQRMVYLMAAQSAQGSRVIIYRTHNRGKSWQHVSIPFPGQRLGPKPNVFDAYFQNSWISARSGAFVLGGRNARSAGYSGAHLMVTQDGGAHWRPVFAALPSPAYFVMSTPHTAYVAGNTGGLWRINLATGSRTAVLTGDIAAAPTFWDHGQQGLAAVQAAGHHVSLWETRDGGADWQKVSTLPASGQLAVYALGTRAWWVWETGSHGRPLDATGSLWRGVPIDGRIIWTRTTVPQGLPARHAAWLSAQFVTPEVGYTVFQNNLSPLSEVYVTHDGGKSWTRLSPVTRVAKSQVIDVNGHNVAG